jgi:hypothetical protein
MLTREGPVVHVAHGVYVDLVLDLQLLARQTHLAIRACGAVWR